METKLPKNTTLFKKNVAPNQKNVELFEGLNKIKKQLYRNVWHN